MPIWITLWNRPVAYDEVTYRGLHQFVRYIEQFRRQQEDLGEVNLFGQEENAVRIMTIHKSKGLEFPVCILMGLGKTLKVPDRKAVRTDSEFGISIQAEDPEISTIKNTFMFQAMGHKNPDGKSGRGIEDFVCGHDPCQGAVVHDRYGQFSGGNGAGLQQPQ